MSYPPLSGYGGYYDANQQSSQYSSNRQNQANPYAPVTFPNDRQSQYSTTSYDWQGQSQQNYGQNAQQTYSNDNYAAGQTGQYEYRRENTGYPAQTNNRNQYETSTTSTRQNLQGLNNLAYASGLDPKTSTRNQQATTTAPTYNAPTSTAMSPGQPSSQRQYSTQPPTTYSPTTTNVGTPQMSAAAQALAGAVNRKNQQAANPPRSQSPYTVQPQHQRASPKTSRSPNISKHRAPASSTGSTSTRNAANSSSQLTSISNLMSPNDSASTENAAAEHVPVPTYIDPSQVFNPYHREHERRRKEAAEAEKVRKQNEAKRQADEARKKADQEAAATLEAAAAKMAAAAAQAAKSPEQQPPAPQVPQKKPKPKAAPKSKKKDATAKAPTPAPPTPAPADDDMAAQMKLMMDKMKEFRQQDPSMFQKLWEDMRKGGANPAGGAPAVGSSSKKPPPAASPKVTKTPAPKVAQPPLPIEEPSMLPPVDLPSGQPAPKRQKQPRPVDLDPNVPLNGWKVIVENNGEDLPDVGRFPAERRIRQSYATRPPGADRRSVGPAAPATEPLPTGPPLMQPLPAKNATGGVEWPKDKRAALAKAAIDALKSEAANTSIEIPPTDITTMLDQNPNYIELCELLELKGLKFNRGQFARTLLSSVPDLSKGQKQEPVSTALPMMRPPPGIPPLGQPPSLMMYSSAPPTPLYHGPYPGMIKMENKKRKSLPPARPEPPPGSKEAMARKRNFSELFDLTQLQDNDDYVLSTEEPRQNSPEPESMDLLRQFQAPSGMPPPLPYDPYGRPQNSHFPTQYAYPGPPPAAPQPAQKPKTILARAVNKNEALNKEYYDPKTVARDVLIAAGRHPTERSLNSHMLSLLHKYIELDSDLTSFEWEAIDPGGPPLPKVPYVDIPAVPPRFRIGERATKVKRKKEAINGEEGPSRNLPSSEGRDTPHASTSTSTALAAQLDFRSRHERSDVPIERGPSRLRESIGGPSEAIVTPAKRKASTSLDAAPRTGSPASMSGVPTWPSGKRKGRPPGAKNKTTSLAALRKQHKPVVEIASTPSSPQTHAVYKCRWPRCGDELHNLETLRKHVAKKHGPEEEQLKETTPYGCWWKHCAVKGQDGTYSPTHKHDSMEGLLNHLNKTHLHELAMKFGDGPRTSPNGKL